MDQHPEVSAFILSVFGLNWASWLLEAKNELCHILCSGLSRPLAMQAQCQLAIPALWNSPLATQGTSPAGDSNPPPASCQLSQRSCVHRVLSMALLSDQHPNPQLPKWVLGFLCEFCRTFLEVQPWLCDELFHVKSRWSSLSLFLWCLCANSKGCVGRTPAHPVQH